MSYPPSEHHNSCPRCPIVGENPQDKPEWYQFLALRFNIRIAQGLTRIEMLHRVDPPALATWLESTQIWEAHLDHLPPDLGPGIMVTLPNNCGRLLIDGNHRAAQSLREGREFLVYLLPERATYKLLCKSMSKREAEFYWKRLKAS
ncbi:hypothetical protein [Acidicapsa ligni]|uniref:hypothetical protein n=1 Tax=Acidicapsa ligni TaxID=542300 RepID=UPI0021DFF2BF|nr:hypothetical protein [Acidicapsa ligni]